MIKELKNHIKKIEKLHHSDLKKGFGETLLPNALVGDRVMILARVKDKQFLACYVLEGPNAAAK